MAEPRNIFSARSSPSEPGSVLAPEQDSTFIAVLCILNGSQRQYVGVEGPLPGDARWVMLPGQARALARELERMADEAEEANRARFG